MAAIAVTMHLPVSASEVAKVAKEYGVDHREVMSAVTEMLYAEEVAESDMKCVIKSEEVCYED